MENLENKVKKSKGKLSLPGLAIQLTYLGGVSALDTYTATHVPYQKIFEPLAPIIIGLEVVGMFGIAMAYSKIYNYLHRNKGSQLVS